MYPDSVTLSHRDSSIYPPYCQLSLVWAYQRDQTRGFILSKWNWIYFTRLTFVYANVTNRAHLQLVTLNENCFNLKVRAWNFQNFWEKSFYNINQWICGRKLKKVKLLCKCINKAFFQSEPRFINAFYYYGKCILYKNYVLLQDLSAICWVKPNLTSLRSGCLWLY